MFGVPGGFPFNLPKQNWQDYRLIKNQTPDDISRNKLYDNISCCIWVVAIIIFILYKVCR